MQTMVLEYLPKKKNWAVVWGNPSWYYGFPKMGGFHKWRYPKIDSFFEEQSHTKKGMIWGSPYFTKIEDVNRKKTYVNNKPWNV